MPRIAGHRDDRAAQDRGKLTVPISIEQISVENLGPLGDRTLDLGRLNLIYGRNETGKTYLVEFLLRSLFRHSASWPMRDELGRGKVLVSGLNAEPSTFTPDGAQKLEDRWQDSHAGLPTNMARLMVVKGAELELTETGSQGVDRAVLKAALSSEALIDQIANRIPATVREASVVDGRLEAAQRGDVKTRSTLEEERQRLQQLSDEVENRYAQGRLRTLELSREQLQKQLSLQRDARRHAAYLLNREKRAIQARRAQLPDDQLEALERDIDRYQDKRDELGRLRDRWRGAKAEVEHYPWLKQAVELWERRALEAASAGSGLAPVAAGFFMVAGLGMALTVALLDLIPTAELIVTVGSVGVFLLGLGLWISHVARTRRRTEAAINAAERSQIEAEYEQRFGQSAGGLTGLMTQEEALRDAQARFEHLTTSIEESGAEAEKLAAAIARQLDTLGASGAVPEMWPKTVQQMRDWDKEQTDKIHQIDLRLSQLGVDESDYRPEPAEVEFSAERLLDLEVELEQLERQIEAAQRDLDGLKHEIARETGNPITSAWTELLESLWQRRRQADSEYRTTTARILGQIGVAQVLERIRAEEDEKIRDGLRAHEVTDLLSGITNRRRSLDYEDGQLLVRGETADYRLSELSTGAREQVLLALRMGFASRLAGGEPLFLILDDAFQHSDWERRQRLVDEVVELAETGWQISYLTMDDHLRDLFVEAGERAFGDNFHYHEI